MKAVGLLPVNPDRGVPVAGDATPDHARRNSDGTAVFYNVADFAAPWIGYVSLHEGSVVGGGGFKGPPGREGVEIAYYTAPGLEGRGFATATVRALIRLARLADPALVITALTVPGSSASATILGHLGFVRSGTAIDPDAGEVWAWRLDREAGAAA